MNRLQVPFVVCLAALLAVVSPAKSQERGDGLQLFSYGVTPSTRPNVTDGQIAASLDPDDWQAAYVRVMQIGVNGDPSADPRPLTMLVANDMDSLYIGVAVQLPNASIDNQLTLFFDQSMPGMLEGAAGAPGEYYVSARANGSELADGHWNGTAWAQNPTRAVRGIGLRKGTSAAERLYNFEFAFPLAKTGDGLSSYLDIEPGEEIGVFPRITLNTGDTYYWLDANGSPTDPSTPAASGAGGWGQILTLGDGIADRNVVSLAALNIVPTIDGNISDDADWRFSFQKDIILTDLQGAKLPATLRLKETAGPEALILGLSVEGLDPAPADWLAVYFDEGPTGGNRDFILTTGDNAARVTGAGTFEDWHFDTNDWFADAASHGQGAAGTRADGRWEVEMRVPFGSGDPLDLDVVPEDKLGALLEYYDSAAGRSYWWSATINDRLRVIDPVDPVYNALGWGFLQTGGPFIQPIYPEAGDVLSGEYPLAVYAIDPSDPDPGHGIEWIRYEIRRPDPASGSVTVLGGGEMTRVVDPAIPIWTATLNTAAFDVSPTTPLLLVFEVYDGEVDPVSVPLDVRIDNSSSTQQLSDPDVSVDAPAANATVSGAAVTIEYSASSHEFLSLGVVELYIDGALVESHEPDTASSFSGTYTWNTIGQRDGEHVIQVRATNSLGFEATSPAVVVVVDNEPPEITDVEAFYPEGQVAASLGQEIVIRAEARDDVSALDPATVFVFASEIDEATEGGRLMVDDGSGGDAVAGDGVYSATLVVSQTQTGSFPYTVRAADVVGNSTEVTGAVLLDNDLPTLSVALAPAPANGEGLSGEIYVSEVLVTGAYADLPDAASIESVRIRVRNAEGHDVNDSPLVLLPTEDRRFSRVVRLVVGVNDVVVSVLDRAGNRTDVVFTLVRVPASETELVGEDGGTVTSPDGTSVTVPEGALLSPQEITIRRFPVDELPPPLSEQVTLVGAGHEFGPTGLVFHEPVSIRLTYADADLDLDQNGMADFDEAGLDVFYWDGFRWIKTDASGRSAQENWVSFTTNHFSTYALGVDEQVDEFRMYWSRNPFVASEGTTAVLELPNSGRISLRIYDMEGDLVRTIADDEAVSGSASRNWDGRGDFDGYVGSGIYIYVFEYDDDSGPKRVIRKPIGVVQ